MNTLVHLALGPITNRAYFGLNPFDADFIDIVARMIVRGYPAALADRPEPPPTTHA